MTDKQVQAIRIEYDNGDVLLMRGRLVAAFTEDRAIPLWGPGTAYVIPAKARGSRSHTSWNVCCHTHVKRVTVGRTREDWEDR